MLVGFRGCPEQVRARAIRGRLDHLKWIRVLAALGRELVEQGLCLFKVRRVEAFREPAVDRREQVAGFSTTALVAPQPSCRLRTRLPARHATGRDLQLQAIWPDLFWVTPFTVGYRCSPAGSRHLDRITKGDVAL